MHLNLQAAALVVALPWSETTQSSTTDSTQGRKGRLRFVEIPVDTAEHSLTNWSRYDRK